MHQPLPGDIAPAAPAAQAAYIQDIHGNPIDAAQWRLFEWFGKVKSRLPKYSNLPGTPWAQHEKLFKRWARENRIRELVNLDDQKCSLLASLQAQAIKNVELYTEDTVPYDNCNTLDEYIELIRSVFQPASERLMSKLDFEARVQDKNESVREYAAAKIALWNIAYTNNLENCTILKEEFAKGIWNREVKREIIGLPASTTPEMLIEGAISAVAKERQRFKTGCAYSTSLDGLEGNIQGYEANRYWKKRDRGTPMEVDSLQQVNSNSHSQREETRDCYHCQKRGHLAKQCPNKTGNKKNGPNSSTPQPKKPDIICHYCNKRGHIKSECRKFQRDKASGKVRDISETDQDPPDGDSFVGMMQDEDLLDFQ